MSNYYIMSTNQTQEGQPQPPQQYFVNPYPTAPPVIIEENQIQTTINPTYPVYNTQSYNPAAQTRVITYADYENYPRAPQNIHGPRRQRVIMVDELDYQRRREAEKKKSGFWKGLAALFCCLFCCCPIGPGC